MLRRTFVFRKEIGGICFADLTVEFDAESSVEFSINKNFCTKEDEERISQTKGLKETVLNDVDAFLREGGIDEKYRIETIEYSEIRAFRYGEKLYAWVTSETTFHSATDEASEYGMGHLAVVIVDLENYLK